jgi:hypothetical protein
MSTSNQDEVMRALGFEAEDGVYRMSGAQDLNEISIALRAHLTSMEWSHEEGLMATFTVVLEDRRVIGEQTLLGVSVSHHEYDAQIIRVPMDQVTLLNREGGT